MSRIHQTIYGAGKGPGNGIIYEAIAGAGPCVAARPVNVASFARAEQGAVTVDWVVLSAAVVALGVLTVLGIRSGSDQLAAEIDTATREAVLVMSDFATARGGSGGDGLGEADGTGAESGAETGSGPEGDQDGLVDACTAMTAECGYFGPEPVITEPVLTPIRPAPEPVPEPVEAEPLPAPTPTPIAQR